MADSLADGIVLTSSAPAVTIDPIEPSQRSLLRPITLDVEGMKCAGCVRSVEKRLSQYPGIQTATVNLLTAVATVEWDATVNPNLDVTELAAHLTQSGFPTQARTATDRSPEVLSSERADRQQWQVRQQRQDLAIAIGLLALSTIGHLHQFAGLTLPGLSNIWFHCGLAAIALAVPGRSMIREGWQGLRRGAPNMNTLVSLGTLTAFTASLVALLVPQLGWECFFDEPVMLVGFILLGRTLEQQAKTRAAAALQALFSLQPQSACLIAQANKLDQSTPDQFTTNQTLKEATFAPQTGIEVPIGHVRSGEWVQVLPGEKIPVDGEIMVGKTTIDESMLTGEALPIAKQPGDAVSAGTLNQSGAIALRVTRVGQDTTLARMAQFVEAAQTRKAPIQKLADTIAGYFTYGVITLAVLTFLFWYFLGSQIWPEVLQVSPWSWGAEHAWQPHHLAHGGLGHSVAHNLTHDSLTHDGLPQIHPQFTPLLLGLKLAIAVLVIACPCVLGLATPTAILVGSGLGAERGLLIRGGDVLEQVHHLDTIVLDKTGTLTTGHPVITDCITCDPAYDSTTLLQLAATVESGTHHPLANAILQKAHEQKLDLLAATEFYTEPGCGISALVQTRDIQQPVLLGNDAWLNQHQITVPVAVAEQAHNLAAAGKTIVYLAIGTTLIGLIAATDRLRPEAQSTISQLQHMGLKVMILTGDRQATAAAIAQTLNLDPQSVLADVQPEQKAAAIAQLQAQGHRVGMVGDGINDAPALAQAEVGIALKSGTEVAIETADIVLMRDRLTDIDQSIRLSRATFSKIQQNLFWAFAYNLLALPIAAGALLPSLGILLSPAAAAALMALSSVSVVTNSLLLRRSQSQ